MRMELIPVKCLTVSGSVPIIFQEFKDVLLSTIQVRESMIT